MKRKYTIAVLFGGCSPEYDVSLHSAYSVLTALDRERFDPIPLGITREGEWFRFCGRYEAVADGTWCADAADLLSVVVSQSRALHGFYQRVPTVAGERWEPVALDAAFPVLHGRNGEDGTVQGLLELAGIPTVGCGVLASALCMDKARSHALARAAGIDVPRSVTGTKEDDLPRLTKEIEAIGFPLFVKPLRAGSSFGISKVTDASGLEDAVALALEYDDVFVLEENIEGFEVGCAVLGSSELTTGRADEIELAEGFFDYTEKYTLKTSRIHVPARISPEDEARVRETAGRIYRALGCSGFARVDMFFTPDRRIVFNEVNTIPGFTEHSRFPSMLRAVGIPFEQVIEKAIALAVEK